MPAPRRAPLAALLAALAAACSEPGPRVEIRTQFGRIVVEVDSARAPVTAANFLRYVDEGRYDGATFYRVRREEAQLMKATTAVVQGGLWSGDTTRALPPARFESTRETGLRHADGTVSMARFAGERSVRSEFFIVLGTQPHLDFRDSTTAGLGYAAFGRVVEGMELVQAMARQPTSEEEILRRRIPFRVRRLP